MAWLGLSILRPFLRQIVFSPRAEYLDRDRVFQNLGSVSHIHRDVPRIPCQRVVFAFPDLQHYVSFDQVSSLLIRMCVVRKDAALPQQEFGHQCAFAEDECLLPDSGERLRILFGRVFLKHDDVPFFWPNVANQPRSFYASTDLALLFVYFECHFTIFRELKHWPPSYLPVIAINVGKVSTETAPVSIFRFLNDPSTC